MATRTADIHQSGSMIVVGFADNIMVGRYSTLALASASFVNNVFNVAVLCCMGFTYGVLPLSGALFSKGDKGAIGSLVRNALLLNVLYTILLTALMTLLYFNVHRLGQPVEPAALHTSLFPAVTGSTIPISVFNVFAQWSYSIQDTTTPMWIVLTQCLQHHRQLRADIRQFRMSRTWAHRRRHQHSCGTHHMPHRHYGVVFRPSGQYPLPHRISQRAIQPAHAQADMAHITACIYADDV